MLSAEVVCCKQLPNITDKLSIEANSVDSYRSSLFWVRTVCHRGFLNSSADEKSRRLAIGASSAEGWQVFFKQETTNFGVIEYFSHMRSEADARWSK